MQQQRNNPTRLDRTITQIVHAGNKKLLLKMLVLQMFMNVHVVHRHATV